MNYHFNINNQSVGPLNDKEIKDYIIEGKIDLHTLSWTEGMEKWKIVSDVPELLSSFPELNKAPSPPPLPSQAATSSPLQGDLSVSEGENHEDLAEFGERFLAGLIDVFVLLIPVLIVDMILPLLGGMLVQLAYYAYFMSEIGGGQTLGYKAMKLRLVDESSCKLIPLASIFLWYLVLALAGLIGWIWFFTDKNHRMLHNIASKTVVKKVS